MQARQLLDLLLNTIDEQLDMDLTVYDAENNEYFPIETCWEVVEEDDILDVGSIVLVIKMKNSA